MSNGKRKRNSAVSNKQVQRDAAFQTVLTDSVHSSFLFVDISSVQLYAECR